MTTNAHDTAQGPSNPECLQPSSGYDPPPKLNLTSRHDAIPFMQRPTCTMNEATKAIGIGRTKLYELINDGQIKSILVGRRRLIQIASLLRYLGLGEQHG